MLLPLQIGMTDVVIPIFSLCFIERNIEQLLDHLFALILGIQFFHLPDAGVRCEHRQMTEQVPHLTGALPTVLPVDVQAHRLGRLHFDTARLHMFDERARQVLATEQQSNDLNELEQVTFPQDEQVEQSVVQ